jgi:hypothetical protein
VFSHNLQKLAGLWRRRSTLGVPGGVQTAHAPTRRAQCTGTGMTTAIQIIFKHMEVNVLAYQDLQAFERAWPWVR